MRKTRVMQSLCFVTVAWCVTGCEKSPAPAPKPPTATPAKPAEPEPAEPSAPSEPVPTPAQPAVQGIGHIKGEVKWAAAPRPAKPINVSADPNCARIRGNTPLLSERLVINPNNTLMDVFVYVRNGLPAGRQWEVPESAVLLDQKGCQYVPHVFGVMAGQTLTIRNSDGTAHNINCSPKRNTGFNKGQPQPGMQFDERFTQPEIMVPFKCDVHPWMSAYCAVLDHPFFDTSDAGGVFQIRDLPAGTYTLGTWVEHPGLSAQTVEVTVKPGETTEVTITYPSP